MLVVIESVRGRSVVESLTETQLQASMATGKEVVAVDESKSIYEIPEFEKKDHRRLRKEGLEVSIL